MQHSTLYEVKL